MEIGYTADQEELRTRLRGYYEKLLDPDTVAELSHSRGIGGPMRAVWKQMCADGWAGIGWPEEYGGQGRSAIEQFVFFDESMRAGAPVPMLTINSVAPTIMRYGSDEQKQFFLPRILAGDIHFCIGYSEPGAGTDLASLTTRAVRDGDEYVINGQKMWTSLAADADYCWLAVRTNPEVKKHQGISLIILPMDTPGITVSPLDLLVDHNVNQVFLDDVRVSVDNCVGGENNGWTLITNQLNHERVTLCASGTPERALAEVRGWAQDTKLADGGRVIDLDWVRLNLARVHAHVEVLRLMNWQVAWEATVGVLDIGHCSSVKVFGTESNLESWRLLMEVLGAVAYLKPDAPGALLRSRLEGMYRGTLILTFGGGTNESQRDLISQFSLGLPREPLMDLSFSTDQVELQELARRILGDGTAHEHVKAVLATEDAVDRELWHTMAEAGLVGISLPESVGGGGLGFLETCIVLEEVGRTAAPIPALAVMGLGGTALAHFGGVGHLEGVADGGRVVTAALVEPLGDAFAPTTTVESEGGRLTGEKVCVPAGLDAARIVVTADAGLFVVDPASDGVTVEREDTTSGVPEARLVLRDAPAEQLAGPEGVAWLVEHAQAAMCVMAAGACAAALELTANYTKSREQFGRPIASFQAVSQRAADAYIDTEAVRLTAWQAAWRLDTGLPASEQVAIAKFWASEGAQRVVHAAHHLHGGMGVDRDYPLYRFFLLVKQLELSLGSATPSLLRLGGLLADTPVR